MANVALQYLKPATLDATNWILYNDSIVSVATWADTYRYTTAGAFSAPWHYVDANDNPPDGMSTGDLLSGYCWTASWVLSGIHWFSLQHRL